MAESFVVWKLNFLFCIILSPAILLLGSLHHLCLLYGSTRPRFAESVLESPGLSKAVVLQLAYKYHKGAIRRTS